MPCSDQFRNPRQEIPALSLTLSLVNKIEKHKMNSTGESFHINYNSRTLTTTAVEES